MLRFSSKLGLFVGTALILVSTIGCSSAEPTPSAATELDRFSAQVAVVSATGKIVPERWAELSFASSGLVSEVLVAEGSSVRAGQMIARLSAPEMESAVSQAEAALAGAQAGLALLQSGASQEQIARVEAALGVAKANLSLAETAREASAAAVQQAEAAVDEACAALALVEADLTADEKELLRQQVEQAKATRYGLQGQRDVLGGQKNRPGYQQGTFEAAEGQALAAENAVTIAQLAQSIALAGATAQERDMAHARLDQAQAAAAASVAQVATTQRQIEVAEAQVAQAQAELDAVLAPSRQQDIDIALAQVAQAEAALTQAQAMLDKTSLYAPFDGTLVRLDLRAGEWALPGRGVASMGDLGSFRIETTDLDEIDVSRVHENAAVTVTFDALSDVELQGTVESIAQQASPGAGGTTYKTIIVFPAQEELRWGMTAFVDIATE